MMFLYTLLSLSYAEDDVFDLVDKKAKVSNHEYLNFEIHHQAPIEKKYVFGYYVYGEGRRYEIVPLIEETISKVNQEFENDNCEKFDIGYFFIRKETIDTFDFPTKILKTKDDFYVFVCSDCQETESEQLTDLYRQVLERSCTQKPKE